MKTGQIVLKNIHCADCDKDLSHAITITISDQILLCIDCYLKAEWCEDFDLSSEDE